MTDGLSDLGRTLVEMTAYVEGASVEGVRVYPAPLTDPKALRERLAMTQDEFAAAYRIPVATLRGWEQGRRAPDATAAAYLAVIAAAPDVAREVLAMTPS